MRVLLRVEVDFEVVERLFNKGRREKRQDRLNGFGVCAYNFGIRKISGKFKEDH